MVYALTLAGLLATSQQPPPPPPPPPTVTLAELVAEARRSSPFRASAAAVSSGTRDAAVLAGRPLNPLVDVRSENWTPAGSRSLPLDVWALVTQPIELGGKRAARLGAAQADHAVAAAGLDAVDRDIAARTAVLYLEALKSRGLVDTLTTTHAGLGTLTDALKRRVDAGTAPEADWLRVEAERARLSIDLAQASLALDRVLTSLTMTVGLPTPLDPRQLIVPEVPPPAATGRDVIEAAVATRPDVRQADARAARAQQALALEHARRLPDPALTTGFKRTAGLGTMVAAITTTLPIFDRNGSATARARGEVVAAQAERTALVTSLVSTARTQVAAAQNLRRKATEADGVMLSAATTVRDAARAAFREGAVDVLKLIDAERTYGDLQRAALDLRIDAAAAAIEARLALGEDPLP